MLPAVVMVATLLAAPEPEPVAKLRAEFTGELRRDTFRGTSDGVQVTSSVVGLSGKVVALDATGKFAAAAGQLMVELMDVSSTELFGNKGTVLKSFNTGELLQVQTNSGAGGHYDVFLPWAPEWEKVTKVKVSVWFEPNDNEEKRITAKSTKMKVKVPADLTVMCVTKNFTVNALTEELAKKAVIVAETNRKNLAEKWLGKELPAWEKPCPIRVSSREIRGGATTFTFTPREPGLSEMEMQLFGSAEPILHSCLPHEVMHCVLATTVGRPVPRWVDEGISLTVEPVEEQATHDHRCREILEAGRGLRLNHLFEMKKYPPDAMTLYAQGHSVCRFLLTMKAKRKRAGSPEQALIQFTTMGMDKGWDEAANVVYGFDNVSELEAAWLAWMQTPESILVVKKPEPQPILDDSTRIPPIKLPK